MILSEQKTHDQKSISFYQFLCRFLEFYINREKQKSNRSQLAIRCGRANASHGSFDSCSAVAKAFENSHILSSTCSICVNDRILKPLFCYRRAKIPISSPSFFPYALSLGKQLFLVNSKGRYTELGARF